MIFPRCLLGLATTLLVGCAGMHDYCHSSRQMRCSKAAYRQSNVDPTRCGYPRDFKDGWITGYYDVAMGSDGCLPAVPPKKYWKCKCGTAKHAAAAMAWFAGYSHGAAASQCSCGGCCNTVPTSPTAVLPDRVACRDSTFIGPAVQDQRYYTGPDFRTPAEGGEEIGPPAAPSEQLQGPVAPQGGPVTPTPPNPPAAETEEMEQSRSKTAALPRFLSSLMPGKKKAESAKPTKAAVAAPVTAEPIVVAPAAAEPMAASSPATPAAGATVSAAIMAPPQAPPVSTPALDYVAPVQVAPVSVAPVSEPRSTPPAEAVVEETVEPLPPVTEETPYELPPMAEAAEVPVAAEPIAATLAPMVTPAPPSESRYDLAEQLASLPPAAADARAVANPTSTPLTTVAPALTESVAAREVVEAQPAVRPAPTQARKSPAVRTEPAVDASLAAPVEQSSPKPVAKAAPPRSVAPRLIAPRPIVTSNVLRDGPSAIKVTAPPAEARAHQLAPVRIVGPAAIPPTKPVVAAPGAAAASKIVVAGAPTAAQPNVRPDASVRVVVDQPSVSTPQNRGVVIAVEAEPIPVHTAKRPQAGAEIRIR